VQYPYHIRSPQFIGSFSTKNHRKYEVIFDAPGPNGNPIRLCAYFNFSGHIALATVSFHPVLNTPIAAGGFRENGDQQVFMPAPNPILFRITNRILGIVLQPVFDMYWIHWSQDYDVIVGGLVWETFIYQEQLSRSTTLQPLNQHNLLNDDLQDFLVEDEEDEDEDEDDEDI
jgi:hypothetical protein